MIPVPSDCKGLFVFFLLFRFLEQGVQIKSLTAKKTPQTKDMRAGTPPRLRDSALEDAYGSRKEETE